MSNYTPVNDFSAKDLLLDNDPEKIILGSDMDAETAAIQTAVNSKLDADASGLSEITVNGIDPSADHILVSDGGVIKRLPFDEAGIKVEQHSLTIARTFADTDMNTFWWYSDPSPSAATLNTGVGVVGSVFYLMQGTATAITVSGTATINGKVTTTGQYDVIKFTQYAANTWVGV